MTTSALCLLNSLFIDVMQQNLPTNVDISSASSIEIQEDVKYLYDFMKKTTSLKVCTCFTYIKTYQYMKIKKTHVLLTLY